MAGDFVNTLKQLYDKLIAFGVILVLVGSLLYLLFQIGAVRKTMQSYEREITQLRPAHPHVEPMDSGRFDRIMRKLLDPPRLPLWTNRLLTVPELRVWCIDCRSPIPFEEMECPFCSAAQPPHRHLDDTFSSLGDGVPDVWKRQHGIDVLDHAAMHRDLDGDGFTAIEEFHAGTNPVDPKSHPPIENRLVLDRIESRPFRLRFMSRSRLPDGNWRVGLNDLSSRQTHWVRKGDEILGFTVASFNEIAAVGDRVTIDKVILERGRLKIELVWQEDVEYQEHTAHLHFVLDDKRFALRRGDTFDIRLNRYALIGIDTATPSVVIIRGQDRKQFTISRAEVAPVEKVIPVPAEDVQLEADFDVGNGNDDGLDDFFRDD